MTKKFIILDTETTGLEVQQGHRIIEIGAVLLNDRKKSEEHFHTYLNPSRLIDEEASKVHGIMNEDLLDKPYFEEVAEEFLEFVDGSTLVIHNAAFDVGFLNNELKQWSNSLIYNGNDFIENIINIDQIHRIWRLHQNKKKDYSNHVRDIMINESIIEIKKKQLKYS